MFKKELQSTNLERNKVNSNLIQIKTQKFEEIKNSEKIFNIQKEEDKCFENPEINKQKEMEIQLKKKEIISQENKNKKENNLQNPSKTTKIRLKNNFHCFIYFLYRKFTKIFRNNEEFRKYFSIQRCFKSNFFYRYIF